MRTVRQFFKPLADSRLAPGNVVGSRKAWELCISGLRTWAGSLGYVRECSERVLSGVPTPIDVTLFGHRFKAPNLEHSQFASHLPGPSARSSTLVLKIRRFKTTTNSIDRLKPGHTKPCTKPRNGRMQTVQVALSKKPETPL